MPKINLRQNGPQQEREYSIKGYVHLRTGELTLQIPKTIGNFKFVLVFVDNFSGWVEAYPTRTEKAIEVAKLLLKEILLRFGLPYIIQSNN